MLRYLNSKAPRGLECEYASRLIPRTAAVYAWALLLVMISAEMKVICTDYRGYKVVILLKLTANLMVVSRTYQGLILLWNTDRGQLGVITQWTLLVHAVLLIVSALICEARAANGLEPLIHPGLSGIYTLLIELLDILLDFALLWSLKYLSHLSGLTLIEDHGNTKKARPKDKKITKAATKAKQGTPTIPDSKFPLANLPGELIDIVVREVVAEDSRDATGAPMWLNLAKTCRYLYESVTKAYWKVRSFRVAGWGTVVQMDALGWYYEIAPQHLSPEAQALRGIKSARDHPRLQYIGLPRTQWLRYLVIAVEQIDPIYCQIFVDRNRCAENGSSTFSLPNVERFEISGATNHADPKVSDWPWFWKSYFYYSELGTPLRFSRHRSGGRPHERDLLADVPCIEVSLLRGDGFDENSYGGLWVAIRILEEILATMPRLMMTSILHELYDINLARGRGSTSGNTWWGNIVGDFGTISPENRMRRFQFHQNGVKKQAARILRERKANGGTIVRLTKEQLKEQHLLHHAALLQVE